LLKDAGVDFSKHKDEGIELSLFAEHLFTSGLVLSSNIIWICFHGVFDFAYLLKLVTGENKLPENKEAFKKLLDLYFPNIYDVKVLGEPFPHLHGSLSKTCQILQIEGSNLKHQAGNDSRLTSKAFFELLKLYTYETLKEKHNKIFGIDIEEY